MKNINNQYLNIVKDILENEEFLKLKNCEHHGITRFEHSLKVSYLAYRVANKIKLKNIVEVARGGLLHDFFLDENVGVKDKFLSYFTHPLKAVKNTKKIFKISQIEEDIIKSHMFPITFIIPKYKESWLVSCCDKIVALKEFSFKFGYQLRYATNLTILLLFNIIK